MNQIEYYIMALMTILFNFILGGLFLWFSTSEARYESPDCESLRFYSFIFALVTSITFIIQVIILVVSLGVKDAREMFRQVIQFYGFISFWLLGYIYVILLDNEPCGDLRILVVACFLITLSSIFFGCCVFWVIALKESKVCD